MKRKLLLLFFLIPYYSVFSIDWKNELENQFISKESINLGHYELGNNYKRENIFLKIEYNLECIGTNNGFYLTPYMGIELPREMNIFKEFDLRNDGYLYGKIPNEPLSCEPVREVPVIFGNEFSFAIPNMTSYLTIGSEEYKEALYNIESSYRKDIKNKRKVFNYSINTVNSSTHLIETRNGITFNYSGERLDNFLYHIGGEYKSEQIFPFCFPWVENTTGPGIGEWIEFELNTPQTITYILNGFVDGNRMHLYKANSRLKEAEITGWTKSGKEIKQNVHFEDFVYFKTVQFSEPVIKFRITIKEAYPGEKWQDTCISAVMFPVERK